MTNRPFGSGQARCNVEPLQRLPGAGSAIEPVVPRVRTRCLNELGVAVAVEVPERGFLEADRPSREELVSPEVAAAEVACVANTPGVASEQTWKPFSEEVVQLGPSSEERSSDGTEEVRPVTSGVLESRPRGRSLFRARRSIPGTPNSEEHRRISSGRASELECIDQSRRLSQLGRETVEHQDSSAQTPGSNHETWTAGRPDVGSCAPW